MIGETLWEGLAREYVKRETARIEAELEAALQRGETPWLEIRPDGTQRVITDRPPPPVGGSGYDPSATVTQ